MDKISNDNFNSLKIIRPLIYVKKAELKNISKKVFNFFIDDPSNLDEKFKRIRIRNLIKTLEFEGLDKNKLKLTIKNLKDSNSTVDYFAKQNLDQNSVFYAGKAKTFDEEKNVADKAPVEGVNIVNISTSNESKKKDIKISKKFNYIIKIASFYYKDSAKLVKERIMSETNIKTVNINKTSVNNYLLYTGPYKSLKNLRKDFDIIESLYFENLELIKQ